MADAVQNTYQIRFNHQHGGSGLVWRIFENGVQHLVRGFDLEVPSTSSTTNEEGVHKWNVQCVGVMRIDENQRAIITHS